MDRDVLTPETVSKLGKMMVMIKVNTKSPEGKALREKYSIRGVPTAILLSPDGSEIDRIIGYDEKEAWLKELLSYAFNMGTLSDLLSRSGDSAKAALLYKISMKYYDKGAYDSALEYIGKAKAAPDFAGEVKDLTELLYGECMLVKDPEKGKAALAAIVQNGPAGMADAAFEDLLRYYRRNKMDDELVALYKGVLPKKGEDKDFLNGYAWTMAEIGRELASALEAAKKAAELSKDDPQVLDTLAEVYYKLGNSKAAVETIDKAIQKEPGDEYYKEQRQKFLEKKKKAK